MTFLILPAQEAKMLLQKVFTDLEEQGDLAYTLNYLLQGARRIFAVDIYAALLRNPFSGACMHILASPMDVAPDDLQVEHLLSLAGEQDLQVVSNLDDIPEYHTPFTRAQHLCATATLYLRMNHGHRPLGILMLAFRQSYIFSPAELDVLQYFVQQASLVLQTTWLLHRYREVARIGQEINQDLSTIDALFHTLCTLVVDILDAKHAFVLGIYQSITNTRDMYLVDEGHFIRHVQIDHRRDGACRYVLETQQPILVQQLSRQSPNLPFQIARVPETEPKESFIFVPLSLRGRLLGVLSIQHPQPFIYNQEDLALLQVLANHTALALHNMHLYHNLRQLNETGQLLTRQIDLEHPIQTTIEKIQFATDADIVILYPTKKDDRLSLGTPLIADTRQAKDESIHPLLAWLHGASATMLHHTESFFLHNDAFKEDLPFLRTDGTIIQRLRDTHIQSLAVVPLEVDKEIVGVLFVLFRQAQPFDTLQRLLIDGLAHSAAIGIRNAQVLGSITQRRIRELEALQQIDRDLNRSLEVEPVLEALLDHAFEFTSAEGASVLLYDSKKQSLSAKVTKGTYAGERCALRLTPQNPRGLAWWVLQHKQPVRVNNVHTDLPWRDIYYSLIADTVSEMDIPLIDGEETVGVINFESSKEGAFSREDLEFLLTLAGQAVLAIKKAQAYEREKRLAEERQVLNEISKEITGLLDVNRVFDLILEKALLITKSHTGVLMLQHPRQALLLMAAEHGVVQSKKWQPHSLDEGVVGHVARTKCLLNVDPSQPPWSNVYLDYIPGTRSELAVPMIAGGTVRGVLNIESTEVNLFDERDERLLQGLADLAVVALRNAELYQEAEKETERLTLLYQVSRELGEVSEWSQLEQGYQIVVRLAMQHSRCNVVLRRYNEATTDLILVQSSPCHPMAFVPSIGSHEGINGLVTRTRRTVYVEDVLQTPPELESTKFMDPAIRSIVVVPIQFKERYYGTLGLSNTSVDSFQETDVQFFEGLAQQLASTIYRLEVARSRQESEQRAKAAEEISLIGQSAMELTHRLGNDLGLVQSYAGDIRRELAALDVQNLFIERKLKSIVQSVRTVLDLSGGLKQVLMKSNEATVGDPVQLSISRLLKELLATLTLQPSIRLKVEIEKDVTDVLAFPALVTDTLHNLVMNAIEAMEHGGTMMVRAYNTGQWVAVDVEDTGIGIEANKLSMVYGLFYSTKDSSGFGLWSARRNAIRNRGDLLVKSVPRRGTTFTLLLPRADSEVWKSGSD